MILLGVHRMLYWWNSLAGLNHIRYLSSLPRLVLPLPYTFVCTRHGFPFTFPRNSKSSSSCVFSNTPPLEVYSQNNKKRKKPHVHTLFNVTSHSHTSIIRFQIPNIPPSLSLTFFFEKSRRKGVPFSPFLLVSTGKENTMARFQRKGKRFLRKARRK